MAVTAYWLASCCHFGGECLVDLAGQGKDASSFEACGWSSMYFRGLSSRSDVVSFRDKHEFLLIQHLLTFLNPKLLVKDVVTYPHGRYQYSRSLTMIYSGV